MCDFCHTHGEGEIWYLRAQNYADDMLSDLRRRRYARRFFTDLGHLRRGKRAIELVGRLPAFLRRVAASLISGHMKKVHYGQVVPIEDIAEILSFTNAVVRLPCVCRKITINDPQRYCYGLSLSPDPSWIRDMATPLDPGYARGPDTSLFETLSPAEALSAMRRHEDEGLCHTIWTLHTPFIGGICNCNAAGCIAIASTHHARVPLFFRGERVARTLEPRCAACGQCSRVCPFDALHPTQNGHRSYRVDPTACYGCGICRAACGLDAIELVPRTSHADAAHLW